MKISILFGAGAEGEKYFGICNGNDFILDSIYTKKEKLYEALANKIYKNIKIDKYINNYEREFLFNKKGKPFINLIDSLIDKNFVFKSPETNCLIDDIKHNGIDKSGDSLNKLYEIIIKENVNAVDDKAEDRKAICEYLTFMGTLESYFSSIVNPLEYGQTRFWKLVNYYWSAYFSILIPILDNVEKYKEDEEYNKNKYAYVLGRLNEISEELFDDNFIENFNKKENYYSEVKKLIEEGRDIAYIFTTNYTPFVNLTGLAKDKICYLAGKLNQFEYPEELYVKEINTNNKLINRDMAFPFIMTQVPVKPIVEAKQINEYAKFIKYLNDTDILIIIGYNLNKNDNHINAIIRDFVLKKNKELIYCEYSNKGFKNFDKDKKREEVKNSLRIRNDFDNIKIIHNNGYSALLFDKIIDVCKMNDIKS